MSTAFALLQTPFIVVQIGKYQGGKGTGLGLALVRRIIKLSGGRLGVKSKVGVGSTFWVELRKLFYCHLLANLRILEAFKLSQVDSDAQDVQDKSASVSNLSRGQRQLALGLEDLKFARSVGEGETPSTIASDQGQREKELLSFPSPGLHSDEALKNLMNHHGGFDLESQAPSSPGKERAENPASPRSFTMRTDSSVSTRPTALDQSYSGTTACEDGLGADARAQRMTAARSGSTQSVAQTPQRGAKMHTPTSSISAPRPGEGLRVLVVDDDTITRTLMSRLLQRLGCAVSVAENGKAALEKILGDNIPACVLPDSPRTSKRVSIQAPVFEDSHEPRDDVNYRFDCIFLDNQMAGVQMYCCQISG